MIFVQHANAILERHQGRVDIAGLCQLLARARRRFVSGEITHILCRNAGGAALERRALTHVTHDGLFVEFVDGDQGNAENGVRSRRCFVEVRFRRCSIGEAELDGVLGFFEIKDRYLDEIFDHGRFVVLHQTKIFTCLHVLGLHEQVENVFVVQFEKGDPNGVVLVYAESDLDAIGR